MSTDRQKKSSEILSTTLKLSFGQRTPRSDVLKNWRRQQKKESHPLNRRQPPLRLLTSPYLLHNPCNLRTCPTRRALFPILAARPLKRDHPRRPVSWSVYCSLLNMQALSSLLLCLSRCPPYGLPKCKNSFAILRWDDSEAKLYLNLMAEAVTFGLLPELKMKVHDFQLLLTTPFKYSTFKQRVASFDKNLLRRTLSELRTPLPPSKPPTRPNHRPKKTCGLYVHSVRIPLCTRCAVQVIRSSSHLASET
ncbi:hypothetical protein VP01_521g5 [Puccinia sorghi]|uniref:Uncharacterized protein n=1 Tax=Puccinia sorghi TaxID=27349 RepID=A0A0L6UKM8_9BASI|nr:hypothetical protein VP01_521g5 [Puccinia sorghi]